MIQVTYSAKTFWLITERPDWSVSPTATFTKPLGVETGRTNRMARRGHGSSLRVQSFEYTAQLWEADARGLEAGLRAIADDNVAVPFWPAQTTWANRAAASIGGGLMIAWKSDWSQYAIYVTGSEPGWVSAGDNWAPVLFGLLETTNQPKRLTDGSYVWDAKIVESSPAAWGLTVAATAWTNGPMPSGDYTTAPHVLPFKPDWSADVVDTFSITVDREPVGFRRETNQTFYPETVARATQRSFQLNSLALITQMIGWYSDHGDGRVFWNPSWASAVRLTANIASTDTVLQVDTTVAVLVGDFLAIANPATGGILPVKVTAKTGTTLTLSAAVGANLDRHTVTVCPMMLCWIGAGGLTVEWQTGGLAYAVLRLEELPPEYAAPLDETLGSTMGRLSKRAWLYEITETIGAHTGTTYWTSWETDLSYGGQNYTSAWITHGALRRSLNLQDDQVPLTFADLDVNPLKNAALLLNEGLLTVVIRQASMDSGAPTGASTFFTGEITKPSLKGNKIVATCTPLGRRFGQQIPRLTRSPQCFATLFHDGCNLDPAAWVHTAAVVGPVSATFPFELSIHTLVRTAGGSTTYTADWFAGGYIEWGTGADLQRRAIVGSTNPAGGALVVTLSEWFTGAGPAAADAVTLYPGCDQMPTTCQGKFGNYINFRGAPFTPAGNPTSTKASGNNTGGKK